MLIINGELTTSDVYDIVKNIALLIGIVQCFLGLKLYKLFSSITGALFFGVVAMLLTSLTTESIGTILAMGIIFIILGAFLTYKVFIAGLFIQNCTWTIIFVMFLTEGNIIVSAVLGIMVGIASIFFYQSVTIFSTSIAGATIISGLLGRLIGIDNKVLCIVILLIVAGLGIYIQYKLNHLTGLFKSSEKMIEQKEKIKRVIVCPNCKADNNEHAIFCSKCGHQLTVNNEGLKITE